ncbi:MAG: tRNA-dihydrouridine synthase family protein [Deltaproteobacteria bacterium]|nr:tRNA-dihydrouridine synthase family protein [Deltaproteobacteria bacterium]
MATLELKAGRPALVLAPMEGVTDAPMRALMSERGGFSFCVTEFFRVSQDVPYGRAFRVHAPEVRDGWKTPSGSLVQLQLLGGDADKLAETALRACRVGAPGIDLNFGCPAPTVNKHDGGATLLKYPERIREIVGAVRRAVPKDIPVSAKLRLGWDTIEPIHRNAEMAAEGGASWITIHGRTKTQGYMPPAYWGPIGEVRRRLGIPVVANGEIWTLDDMRRCRDETGSEHFMLGRSALADPTLVHTLARELGLPSPAPATETDWTSIFARFVYFCSLQSDSQYYALCRMKLWLRMVGHRHAYAWLDPLKRALSLEEFFARLPGGSVAAASLPKWFEPENPLDGTPNVRMRVNARRRVVGAVQPNVL